jgi:hypothetical protein
MCQTRKYEEHGLLGHVSLWDELDSEIGMLNGQIEAEEPKCFGKLVPWLNKRIMRNGRRRVLSDWAEILLNENLVTDSLTNKRASYAQSRMNLSNRFIKSFPDFATNN